MYETESMCSFFHISWYPYFSALKTIEFLKEIHFFNPSWNYIVRISNSAALFLWLGGLLLAPLPLRSSRIGKPRLSYLRLGRGDIAEAAAGRYESCEGRGTQVKTRSAP